MHGVQTDEFGRETAADENATSYFPLLDRIAEGHFDQATTDQDLYNLFLDTLKGEGHIPDAETLSSFEYAFSIHSAAPRIQAHYQYYNDSILPSVQENGNIECDSWIYFNGQQYCSPDLAASTAAGSFERYERRSRDLDSSEVLMM